MRTALGEPKQLDIQILSQRLGLLVTVDGILIQEHRHWPTSVMPSHIVQKLLKLRSSLPALRQTKPMAGTQLQGSKKSAARVVTRNQHGSVPAPRSPTGPQRWKEQ